MVLTGRARTDGGTARVDVLPVEVDVEADAAVVDASERVEKRDGLHGSGGDGDVG